MEIKLNKANGLFNSETNKSLNINLASKSRNIPTSDYNVIVSEDKIFNDERNNSTTFRLVLNIDQYVSNVLMNIDGENSIQSVINNQSIVPFEERIKISNGWFYYNKFVNNVESRIKTFLEPTKDRFDYKNWDYVITYPYAKEPLLLNSNDNGLNIVDLKKVIVGGIEYYAFGTFTKHGLNIGDSVRLKGLFDSDLNGDYFVISLGLDNDFMSDYYFVVQISTNNLLQLTNINKMSRVVLGLESEYYYRKFKKIPTLTSNEIEPVDLEVYNLAFSNNIYNDKIQQITLINEIDVNNVLDNLNRPITEIYLTLIKKNSNGFFSKVKSGVSIPFYQNINDKIPDINRINNSPTSNDFLESDVKFSNEEFYGDIVEYNRYEVNEKILGEVHHRFSNLNREKVTNINNNIIQPRYEGYTYKAHHRIKIRPISNYIEQGDASVIDVPFYAENFDDGRKLWRDILPYGLIDLDGENIDFPFTNGYHFIHQSLINFVKRQDPFGNYGTSVTSFPSDIEGSGYNDEYVINNPQDIC